MRRYDRPEDELADLDWMLRYGRFSYPGTVLMLIVAIVASTHTAVIAFVAVALAIQTGILAYAVRRRRCVVRNCRTA